jgi:RluA family pseudouridine synthase
LDGEIKPEEMVLWADAHLLAVNKPAGLPALPDGWTPGPHLRSVLEPVYGRLWTVHRLDRHTSGVVVLARTAEAHRALNIQFEAHDVTKVYHALVIGSPAWEELTVDLPLRIDGDRKHRTVIDLRAGKPSVTDLRALERLGRYTLIEARPATGRTHQIRAHLAAQGCPIAVDPLYGDGATIYRSMLEPESMAPEGVERPLLDRLGLHARSLALRHPATGAASIFEAPYPEDFANALDVLRSRFAVL